MSEELVGHLYSLNGGLVTTTAVWKEVTVLAQSMPSEPLLVGLIVCLRRGTPLTDRDSEEGWSVLTTLLDQIVPHATPTPNPRPQTLHLWFGILRRIVVES